MITGSILFAQRDGLRHTAFSLPAAGPFDSFSGVEMLLIRDYRQSLSGCRETAGQAYGFFSSNQFSPKSLDGRASIAVSPSDKLEPGDLWRNPHPEMARRDGENSGSSKS